MFFKTEDVLKIFTDEWKCATWGHLSEISSDGKIVESQSEAGGLDNVPFLLELFANTPKDAVLILHRPDWVEIRLKKIGGRINFQVVASEFVDGVRKEREVRGDEEA